jgi:hypothetical protein
MMMMVMMMIVIVVMVMVVMMRHELPHDWRNILTVAVTAIVILRQLRRARLGTGFAGVRSP